MTDKIEEVKKILDEPVTCTDGNTHYIDENHRRYLAYQICQLFEKPTHSPKLEAEMRRLYPS